MGSESLSAPPKSRDAARTRQALIKSGEQLFSEFGYNRATIEAIAAEAGVNKAMIAYYFGDKAGLYAAVLNDVVSAFVDRMKGRVTGGDPTDCLRTYIGILAETIIERPSYPTMIVREYLDGHMQEREQPARLISEFFKNTQRIYNAGVERGQFIKTDPHMLHLHIVGAIIYFTITRGYRESMRDKSYWPLNVPDAEDFIEHLKTVVLDGLRTSDHSSSNN